MKKKDICIITNRYPNKIEPNILVFLQQLVWEFANQGHKCTVIAPSQIPIRPGYLKLPYESYELTDLGKKIRILRPVCMGLGQSSYLGIKTGRYTISVFEKAVYKIIIKEQLKPDVLYSHFITPAGIVASRISKRLGIPAYMAYGESTAVTIYDAGGPEIVLKELKELKGIVAVSSDNKQILIDNKIDDGKRIKVIPNAYNEKRFYPRDKKKAREKFGFPNDAWIVGYVGWFDNRKGVMRLQKAIDTIPDVYFACAGKGSLKPNHNRCLWSSPVLHKDLPDFYSACDAFVLPTLMEGCCNAIIEAIACGLPVISSDRAFNHDILNKDNSILIDPTSVQEITDAIIKLKEDNDLYQKLKTASKDMADKLTLTERAKKIIEFIE